MADAAAQIIAACLQPLFQSTCEKVALQLKPICGLKKEVEKLVSSLEDLEERIRIAERVLLKAIVDSVVDPAKRDTEVLVRKWFRRLENVYSDVVEKWKAAEIRNDHGSETNACCVMHSSCLHLLDELHRSVAAEMKDLTERLENFSTHACQRGKPNQESIIRAVERLKPETTSMYDKFSLHGRDTEKKTLITSLLRGTGNQDTIPVVGMGGIGKTALAVLAFNDDRVKRHFGRYRFWVSLPYSKFDLYKIGRVIADRGPENYGGLDGLLCLVGQKIRGRRFLLVLDGVWTMKSTEWYQLKEALRPGHEGSKILVTTQKCDVAELMQGLESCIIHLDLLFEIECRSILSTLASRAATEMNTQELEEIHKKFVSKCSGLPLAADALNSSMGKKITKRDWVRILQSDLSNVQDRIFAPFFLSYCQLSDLQRRFFSLLSVFPRNYEIERDDLVEMWMSYKPDIE